MKDETATSEAMKLLLDGSIALSQVEANGIAIDTVYLNQAIQNTEEKIEELQNSLKQDDLWQRWQKKFRHKANLGSREQLAKILFDDLHLPYPHEFTKGGRYRSDEEVLAKVKLPFVEDYIRLEKLKRLKGTFLEGIRTETVDGFLHPAFHLHTVETFRSSSSEPNFQNLPIRDVEIGEIVRRCFIPRNGRMLVEIDYGALEFRIAAAVWKDPEMVKYASDKSLDIHRDMAMEIYLLKKEQVNKKTRYVAKNMFVFPEIYGSYYIKMAQNLWTAIKEHKLEIEGDVRKPHHLSEPRKMNTSISLNKHLRSKGITSLGECNPKMPPRDGTFEHHIQQVERRFQDRFQVLTQTKDRWWKDYQEQGWFKLVTGFVVQGVYSRNFLYNCPIQGPGFHCLLWSLIRIQKLLIKRGMESLIVGQIHDCILLDTTPDELQDVLNLCKKVMTEDIRKEWDWLIVPLEVEVDIVEQGQTWHDKSSWQEKNDMWQAKEKI